MPRILSVGVMMTVALILATSTAPHAANVAVEAVTPSDIRNVKKEATVPPSPPACLDENGNYVDSWVAFSQNEDYQYYWHENAAGFVKSPYRTNQTVDGGIMRTVAQLYAEDLDMNNIAYALYNDDPPGPDTASSTFAHSKGMVLLNDQMGFWLIHSKPNWPNSRADNASVFPDTSYAQSLMCITFNTSSFENVAKHSMVNYPFLYDSFMSTNLVTELPLFNQWVNDNGKSDLLNLTSTVSSRGGVEYTMFAKAKAWGMDLYDDLVAPGLKQALHVETWRNGAGGRMSSNCQGVDDDAWTQQPLSYDILQVATVTMPDGQNWLGSQDHSKWAATIDGSTACVADINRMCSQEKRGGGAVCVTTTAASQAQATPTAYAAVENVWTSFNKSVTDVEGCWQYDPCAGTSTQCYWCPSHEPTYSPTHFPTLALNSASPTTLLQKTLAVGDIAIILYNTDSPDAFTLVALKEISAGIEVLVTDDGWYESTQSFRGSEGVLGFSVVRTMPAGTTWFYEKDSSMNLEYGNWRVVSGTFSLSASGDSILVYAQDDVTADIAFVYGLSTIPWETDLTTPLTSSTSNLPSSLNASTSHASIYFPDSNDNGVYQGATEGYSVDLLKMISNTSYWITNDFETFDPLVYLRSSFAIWSSSSQPSLAPSESVVPNDETADDDDTTFIRISVIAMVCGMTLVFICCCAYTMRNKRIDSLATNLRPRKDRYGSSVAGKVSLLDMSDQRPSEIARSLAGEQSNEI